MDVNISYVDSDEELLDYIDSLNIQGEYHSRGLKYNFDVEVN